MRLTSFLSFFKKRPVVEKNEIKISKDVERAAFILLNAIKPLSIQEIKTGMNSVRTGSTTDPFGNDEAVLLFARWAFNKFFTTPEIQEAASTLYIWCDHPHAPALEKKVTLHWAQTTHSPHFKEGTITHPMAYTLLFLKALRHAYVHRVIPS
jgi:hypothetical protein